MATDHLAPTHFKVHLGNVSTGYIEVGFLMGVVGNTVFFDFGGNALKQELEFDRLTFYVRFKRDDKSYAQYREILVP